MPLAAMPQRYGLARIALIGELILFQLTTERLQQADPAGGPGVPARKPRPYEEEGVAIRVIDRTPYDRFNLPVHVMLQSSQQHPYGLSHFASGSSMSASAYILDRTLVPGLPVTRTGLIGTRGRVSELSACVRGVPFHLVAFGRLYQHP